MVIMIMIYTLRLHLFSKITKKLILKKKIVCIFPKGWKENIDIDEVYKKN